MGYGGIVEISLNRFADSFGVSHPARTGDCHRQPSEPLAITKGSAQVAQVLLVARPCDVNRKLPLMKVEVLLWIVVDVGQAHCRLEEGIPFCWVSHFPFHVVLGLSVQMALQRGDYGVELLSHPLDPKTREPTTEPQ